MSKASSKRRIVSSGSAEPPETQVRRLDVSVVCADGWPSIAPYIVGTPSKIVTRSRWTTSSAFVSPSSSR